MTTMTTTTREIQQILRLLLLSVLVAFLQLLTKCSMRSLSHSLDRSYSITHREYVTFLHPQVYLKLALFFQEKKNKFILFGLASVYFSPFSCDRSLWIKIFCSWEKMNFLRRIFHTIFLNWMKRSTHVKKIVHKMEKKNQWLLRWINVAECAFTHCINEKICCWFQLNEGKRANEKNNSWCTFTTCVYLLWLSSEFELQSHSRAQPVYYSKPTYSCVLLLKTHTANSNLWMKNV